MDDREKTKEQLIAENEDLRRRVTDLEAAAQEQKRLENNLDLTFRLSPMLMCVAGFDGYLKRVNPVYRETYGHSVEELLARPFLEFMHPDDHAALVASVSQLAQGIPVFNVETRIQRPDGSVRWILWSAVPMTEAGTCLCIGQDITAAKQAERELARQRAMLRATIDCLPFNFFAIGPDGRYILQNAISKVHHRADVVGKTPEEISPNEHDLAIWLENNRRAFAGEKVEAEVTLSLGGGERHYYNIVSPIRDDDELYGILGVNVDITDRKRAEDALQKAHDELERRVEERTAELTIAITQLKQAQDALERERRTLEHMLQASDHERQLIAYDIHDGLAQELAGALMQFQVYDQLKDTRPGEAQKAYDGALVLLRRGHTETRRLISGVRPPILDESGVLAAIAHLVHEPAFDDGPKIDFRSRVTFHRLAPVVENVIYRIVQEGLTNARQHSKSERIVVNVVQRGDRLRIEIRDWGVGFDPKVIRENHFGVEGIRERARLLGGKCNIKSKPGEGTSVIVELPVVERQVH